MMMRLEIVERLLLLDTMLPKVTLPRRKRSTVQILYRTCLRSGGQVMLVFSVLFFPFPAFLASLLVLLFSFGFFPFFSIFLPFDSLDS